MAALRTNHRDSDNGRFREGPVPSREKLLAEDSGEQQPERFGRTSAIYLQQAMFAGGLGTASFAWGGGPTNPMGFPGYNGLYLGTPIVYRWMLQHPIHRLVQSIRIAPVAASVWEFEKVDDKAPDEDLKLLRACFAPIRDELITEFYGRACDYGWHAGEPKWELKDGIMWLRRVKPLLHDITQVLRDEYGNFRGLRNDVGVKSKPAVSNEKVTLPAVGQDGPLFTLLPAPFKAWTWAYDSESDYPYGRSWLENTRETGWRDWLDTMQQLQKLGPKISDKVTVVKSPAGTFPGAPDPANGGKPKMVSYRENAEKAITALAAGAAGVWLPTLGLSVDAKGSLDAMKVLVELVNKSLFDIQVLDFGNHAAAIDGYVHRLEHAEMLMFAGGLRSSRVGIDSKNKGSKAEAEEHTDTGTYNAEQDDKAFARGCQPLIDAFMVLNRGDKAKGTWRIKPPSLIDRKAQVIKAVLLALANNPLISEELSATFDIDKMIDGMGMDRKKPFDASAIEQRKQAETSRQNQAGGGKANKTRTKKNPNPEGGRPSGD